MLNVESLPHPMGDECSQGRVYWLSNLMKRVLCEFERQCSSILNGVVLVHVYLQSYVACTLMIELTSLNYF